MIHSIDLRLSPSPARSRIVLDGHDITTGICQVEVSAQAGQMPSVQLGLPIVDVSTLSAKEADVRLTAESRAALLALGWTPPPGEDE